MPSTRSITISVVDTEWFGRRWLYPRPRQPYRHEHVEYSHGSNRHRFEYDARRQRRAATINSALNDGGTARTITKNGGGTLILIRPNTLANGTNLNVTGGTLNLNQANVVGNTGTVTINGGTLNPSVAGSLGTTTSPTNIVIINGTMNANIAGVIGTVAATTVNAGTFNIGANQTIGSLAGGGGTIALGGNVLTVGGLNTSETIRRNHRRRRVGHQERLGNVGPGRRHTFTNGLRINAGTVTATSATGMGTGAVTLAGGTLNLGNAQPLSGWQQDIVRAASDPTTAPYGTSVSVDLGNPGAAFYQQGVNTGQPTFGLPTSRSFVSVANPAVTFQSQPYNIPNAIWINTQGGTGTLTIGVPQSATTLNVLHTAGNGAATYDVQVNFTDGTSTTFAGNTSPDWFNGANPALGGGGSSPGLDRFNRGNGNFDNNGTNPRLYELDLTLTGGDTSKLIRSVTFTKTNVSTAGLLNIMALSLNAGQSRRRRTRRMSIRLSLSRARRRTSP